MNRELSYIGRALLMIVVLFVSIKVLGFVLSIPSVSVSENHQPVAIDSYGSDIKFSSNGIDGKVLFANNCASCHAISKRLTGPALAGVTSRIDKKLLHDWIHNSTKVLKSGNKYFNNLYKEYDKISMTSFPALTDEEIDAILQYISVEF